MSERDPRIDPQPGDVLMIGPQWQCERYEIIGQSSEKIGYGRFLLTVRYRMGESEHTAAIEDFRKWARNAEVVKRGENA
jgi:hypothetical protein